ncbi:MAG: thymidylate synthase [Luminiphilus sp.]|nr:thymidylate synthase [Luminiphilus sp.]
MATQLARQPKARPQVQILRRPESIYDYKFEDFVLEGYDPEPNISAPVAI